MPTEKAYLEVLDMPEWKSKVLRAVAWVIGYRGEHIYCVTLNVPVEGIVKADDKT